MRKQYGLLLSWMVAMLLNSGIGAARSADIPEPGSAEEIAQATTEPRFLSPWVASLPASDSVLSPRKFLHRIPGAVGELADTRTTYAYCRALAQSSPRVKLFTIGHSEEGRDIVLLAIADEAGIAGLDRLKAAPRRWPIRAVRIRRQPSS